MGPSRATTPKRALTEAHIDRLMALVDAVERDGNTSDDANTHAFNNL
jgi:hypothetical protein